MKYLLDTNVLSEPLKIAPNEHLLAKLKRHQAHVCTTAVVWHELWYGCSRLPESTKKARIEQYLSSVLGPSLPRLAYDEDAAVWHAAERARLVSEGLTPGFIDGQIASVAATNGLILVTRNEGDFEPFRDLRVENWFRK